MNKELILLVGNIGSGKSTLAQDYVVKGYVIISRDQLRYAIGGGSYIYNENYERTIASVELCMFKEFAQLGVNILVDGISLNKKLRARYIVVAKKLGYRIKVIVMPQFNQEQSVTNRMKNPHDQPDRELWKSVWLKYAGLYEEPSTQEGIDEIVKWK